jgi:hypothetical protein
MFGPVVSFAYLGLAWFKNPAKLSWIQIRVFKTVKPKEKEIESEKMVKNLPDRSPPDQPINLAQ